MSEWHEDYDLAINNPPKEGDILVAREGLALLKIELNEGNPPFIYGKVNVPEIVGTTPKWYLQGENDGDKFRGWRCIILPRARTELAKKFGLGSETMLVESLRVIRPSQSKKSLLCEIHRFGDEPKSISPSVSLECEGPEEGED